MRPPLKAEKGLFLPRQFGLLSTQNGIRSSRFAVWILVGLQIGKERPSPIEFDLERAIEDVLQNRAVHPPMAHRWDAESWASHDVA